MPKDPSLFVVACKVPTNYVHQLAGLLRDIGARDILMQPYLNGATAPAPKAKTGKLSTIEKSQNQQEWLVQHIKGDVATVDLKEAWVKAGFRAESMYGALYRAVAAKQLKKLKPGLYRRIG
jgi:hypothetical protein